MLQSLKQMIHGGDIHIKRISNGLALKIQRSDNRNLTPKTGLVLKSAHSTYDFVNNVDELDTDSWLYGQTETTPFSVDQS